MSLKIYSTSCPRCNYLIALANKKKIPYTLVTDLSEILKVADENHLEDVPFAIDEDKVYNTEELENLMEANV